MENVRKKDCVPYHSNNGGTRCRSWSKDSATRREFAASTPDVFMECFI